MKQLHKITPYTDEVLEWDEKAQQYILTLEYFKNNYDSVFVDDDTTKRRLKENSKLVYRFIKNRVHSRNRPIVHKVINYTQEGRDFIKEMLDTQMSADVQTGYNDLGKTPALNIANGQDLGRINIQQNLVSVETENCFDDSDYYFGFRIGYQASFPPIFFVMFK